MKIKLPKINKIELDKVINYTSLKKLSFAGAMNIECFDCGDCDVCWECDYDCNYDCDYDCDYNPYDYDCVDDCVCDCDCDCVCDCDFDPWGFGYIPKIPAKKPSASKEEIHIIGVRFVTQTRGCYYYRCKKPEYKIGDTLSVPTQYGNKESRVVFVRTYKDINEYSKDITYALDSLKWAPEKKTLSPEEIKKAEQERIAKEKAEQERIERERQERIRKEEEEKKRVLEEKNKLRIDLATLKNKYKKECYSDINFQIITNLITTFEKKLDNEKYLTYKQDYRVLLTSINEVKTLEQEETERKRKKKIMIVISTVVAIVLLLMFANNVIVPSVKYSKAMNLIENGRYDEAEDVFYELGDYKKSKTYIKLINVKEQCDRKEFTKAISNLESIGGSSTFNIDYNGGTKSNVYISLYGKRINSSEKNGYTFKEYLTNGYTLDVKNQKLIIEVKATYTINQYSITYYLNGGSLTKNNPSGYSVDTDTFTLNEPTKTGYEFLGWTYSGNSTPAKNVKIAKGTTGNLTYTANWKANSYLVRLDSDGGNIVNDLSVVYDSNYSLPTPTKAGYSFLGWYEGNNSVPSSGTWKYTTNLNLVAKWSLKSNAITYYLDGGKADNPSSYNVHSSTFTLNNPVKTGYKFVGWSTSANGTKYMNVTIEKGSTGSKTYYANWEVITYNINYYLDSGTNNLNNPKTYTVEDSVQLKNSTKTGYSFEGWYSDSNFQTKVVTINKGTTGDLNLYAKFTVNTYTITVNSSSFSVKFMMNDGTDSIYETQKVTPSKCLDYPEIPSRSGYTFNGWYTEAECINYYDYTSKVLIDTVLYAGWVRGTGYACLTDGEVTVSMSGSRYIFEIYKMNTGETLFHGYLYEPSRTETFAVKRGDVIKVTSSTWGASSGSYSIYGVETPDSGGTAYDISKTIDVTYNKSYVIPTRTVEGYKFVGYFDENGKQYTDEYGNSLFYYNIEGNITLYEKWIKV